MVLVDAHIVEECRIAAPHHAAAGVLDDVGQVFAAVPAPHPDRVVFRSAQVGAPGFQPVVGRVPPPAELEEGRALGEFVAVEDDLQVAAVARRAADQLVLAALPVLPQVGERSVGLRHALVVLLDAPTHLADQGLLQSLRRFEQGLGMTVLGLEVLPDVGIEHRRIAQHLLPVGVLQPGIVVEQRDAMQGARRRTAGRDRWVSSSCHWLFHLRRSCRAPPGAPAWPRRPSACRSAGRASRRPWCPTSRPGCGRPSRCRNA